MIYAVYRLHLLTELCSVRTVSLRKRYGLALAYALGRFHLRFAYALGRFHLDFAYVLGKFYPYFAYALGNYRYLCRKKQRYNHYDTQTIN